MNVSGWLNRRMVLTGDTRLDAVTRREQSLNLFHALGKVFYNKREYFGPAPAGECMSLYR